MKNIHKKTSFLSILKRTIENRNSRMLITIVIISLVVICILFSGYNVEVNINGTDIKIKLDAG